MGFWHTGYIEFHEPVGLGGEWKPAPMRLRCSHCGHEFASEDELRKHRFESHPLRRPTLFLDGVELGTRRVRLCHPVAPTQIRVEGAERAVLNGHEIPLSDLGSELANVYNDVCRVVLMKDSVEAQFELEIRVASEADLRGVEDQFMRMAASRRLDTRAVEEFIAEASRFKSAIGYCDGICAYLFGLLAKERAADCSLPYESYEAKYAKATEELAGYERSLAHTIGGLIEFHFNHFRNAESLCPGSRLGRVSSQFAHWIESQSRVPKPDSVGADNEASALERLVTEWETERILSWANPPLGSIAKDVNDIETFLKRDLAEFDRVKLHMLLGETLAVTGNAKLALEHVKALRNLPTFENWAEGLIRELGERI